MFHCIRSRKLVREGIDCLDDRDVSPYPFIQLPLFFSLTRAVGCIFAELLNNSPLFPGENDIEQLCCVLRVLGTPNQKTWPVGPITISLPKGLGPKGRSGNL